MNQSTNPYAGFGYPDTDPYAGGQGWPPHHRARQRQGCCVLRGDGVARGGCGHRGDGSSPAGAGLIRAARVVESGGGRQPETLGTERRFFAGRRHPYPR